MPRIVSEEVRLRQAAIRERTAWLVINLFNGSQKRLREALGVSAVEVSRVVNGKLGANPEFIDALARLPGVNPLWVLHGAGDPVLPPTRGSRPIAMGVLTGWPDRHPEMLTGERHPVAEAFDRPSRYWWRVPHDCALVRQVPLALLPGDYILFDADTKAWEGQLDLLVGRLFGVRLPKVGGFQCDVGVLCRDDGGLLIDLFGQTARLRLPLSPKEHKQRFHEEHLGRGRRKIRVPGGKRSSSESESTSSQVPVPTKSTIESQDLVALRVYTARP